MTEVTPEGAGKRRRAVWITGGVGVLILALLGAFLGYGWWTRRGDVTYSRGGADFLDAEQLASAPPSAAPEVAAGGGGPDEPSAPPAPDLAPRPRASASAVPTTTAPRSSAAPRTTAKPAPVATAKAGVQRPATGVYKLAVSGKEGVKFGPLSFCDRTLPSETSMVIAPAQGEPDGSYTFDLRYYPGQPAQHDERQILRFTDKAVKLVFEVGTVTCSGIRQSSEVSYSPTVDRVRFPLKVGTSWSGKAGNDKRLEDYTTQIARTDAVTVGGRAYPVYVIESTATFTGSESGERRRVWWFSPDLGVPLKWTDYIKGGRSGASFTNDVTVTVTELPEPPARPVKQTAPQMAALLRER